MTADTPPPPAIRPAAAGDIPAIAAILNAEILGGTASWQAEPRTASEMQDWAEARLAEGFPVLVADDPVAGITGYASYGRFRTLPGYRHSVEHSLYVAAGARRGGTGRALMEALIAAAREAGHHAMLGGIGADQAASLAFHARMGFREVGRLAQVGAKSGRWLDLVLVQRLLDGRAAPPD